MTCSCTPQPLTQWPAHNGSAFTCSFYSTGWICSWHSREENYFFPLALLLIFSKRKCNAHPLCVVWSSELRQGNHKIWHLISPNLCYTTWNNTTCGFLGQSRLGISHLVPCRSLPPTQGTAMLPHLSCHYLVSTFDLQWIILRWNPWVCVHTHIHTQVHPPNKE